MWIDVIIVAILFYSIIQGFRRGFVYTFVRTIGWIIAVVLGFLWFPHVLVFLKDNTGYYDMVRGKIEERIAEKAGNAADSVLTGLPDFIRDLINNAVNSATDSMASSMSVSMTNLIFNIIGFLLVVIAIKIFLMIITFLFSKGKRSGFIGAADGFFGLFAGALKGLIFIYILLALMVPITGLTGSGRIADQLDESLLGSHLYNNNLILNTVKGFLNVDTDAEDTTDVAWL